MKRIMLLLTTIMSFLLILSMIIAVRGNSLPAPQGSYAIGRASIHWTDETRLELMTELPDDRRELVAHIWYPAERLNSPATAALYFPGLDRAKDAFDLMQWIGLSTLHTHSIENAPLSRNHTRYPVLIFLHGNASNSVFYTSVLEDLASHGYIVVAIDSPYDALAVILSGGRIAHYDQGRWNILEQQARSEADLEMLYREKVAGRVADVRFILDQLERLDAGQLADQAVKLFTGRLDLAHTGIFGHSVGGVAAIEACRVDMRLDACLNMDGLVAGQPYFSTGENNHPVQPIMVMLKALPTPDAEQLAAWGMTGEQWHANLQARIDKALAQVQADGYKVTITGASHQSFSDTPLYYPSLLESLANLRLSASESDRHITGIVRVYAHAFFETQLKGTQSRLLSGSTQVYPDVTVQYFS